MAKKLQLNPVPYEELSPEMILKASGKSSKQSRTAAASSVRPVKLEVQDEAKWAIEAAKAKAERKGYRQGRDEGYTEGFADGFYDGNETGWRHGITWAPLTFAAGVLGGVILRVLTGN